jgi:hypothetical protein
MVTGSAPYNNVDNSIYSGTLDGNRDDAMREPDAFEEIE